MRSFIQLRIETAALVGCNSFITSQQTVSAGMVGILSQSGTKVSLLWPKNVTKHTLYLISHQAMRLLDLPKIVSVLLEWGKKGGSFQLGPNPNFSGISCLVDPLN